METPAVDDDELDEETFYANLQWGDINPAQSEEEYVAIFDGDYVAAARDYVKEYPFMFHYPATKGLGQWIVNKLSSACGDDRIIFYSEEGE